ncbi:MAG: outer membrane lipid asymmetry maintenance protein MlaD [Gammaproteobacteria bacterium]|nr:outer membrane lipid asymmetry maintenance protein MlaD [Gammaproteobacteria bacterium]
MSRRTMEVWVGLFVAAGFAALFMLAMKVSNMSTVSSGDGYEIFARFGNIGGLNVRSPVRASGVLVGRVSKINYDSRTFEAIVTLTIENQFNQFPTDTTASIFTAGLLGEQYVSLTPGAEDAVLKQGDTIMFSDSAMVLERIIGKIVTDKLSE